MDISRLLHAPPPSVDTEREVSPAYVDAPGAIAQLLESSSEPRQDKKRLVTNASRVSSRGIVRGQRGGSSKFSSVSSFPAVFVNETRRNASGGGQISSARGTRKRKRRPSAQQLQDKMERDADNSQILNLTLDVNDLRQQVHDCLVRKSIRETRLLVAREQFNARALQSVDYFFRIFRYGHREVRLPLQQRFLAALLDEDIAIGGGVTGRTQFFEQWRRYKRLFHVRRLHNSSTHLVTSDASGCIVECAGEFEGRVSAATLEAVFPHILNNENLVRRVLNRRLVCPTRTLISFDQRGRIVQYDAHSDVFEAMNALLGAKFEDVVTLMSNAAISTAGSMLPPVDVDQINDDDTYLVGDGADCGEEEELGSDLPTPSHTNTSRSSIGFILS
ncbi:hypothetical protein BBJ28_00002681 [Nothophytophthora sp. Chile5]|nr:hypothetical protein BBJ28_00002681 [Nothophytophthora sp. Chile5]